MNREAIAEWLAERVAEFAGIDTADVDPGMPFSYFGLDSKTAVALASDLAEMLGQQIDPTVLYDLPTIAALSGFLADGTHPDTRLVAEDRTATTAGTPIAIVGMACRFPGARNLTEFWRLLRDGRDAVRDIPASRFPVDRFFDPEPTSPGRMSTRFGGFLDDIAGFDARFFGMNTHEAAAEDPQHRLLLELAVEALDDAGLPRDSVAGRAVGTFVGISGSDYAGLMCADRDAIEAYSATAGAVSVAANRISYFLDLRGPSLAIDTACSSSLVALHYAIRSIRDGECEAAFVAGVNLMLTPEGFIALSKAGMMAPDGRCKAFSAEANGYVRGEGAAVLVVKPLDSALRDGDRIHAVVKGTAVNQDGRSNGLTAPNAYAQMRVLSAACRDARVEPETIVFVEAHGTGTRLGDPIEAKAIAQVYAARRKAGVPCRIGSVKTNIGHLEAAAGIAGVVKTALSLSRRKLPPSLHFGSPNPAIAFDTLNLEVNTAPVDLPSGSDICAGVSSFGFGGTNAHAILSPAPDMPPSLHETRPVDEAVVLPVSAHSEEALAQRLSDMAALLESPNRPPLQAICYTAAVRSSHAEYRHAVVGASTGELAGKLREASRARGPRPPRRLSGQREADGPVFVFSGQGTQWPGMGLDVAAHEPVFAAALRRCASAMAHHADWSLMDELKRPPSKSRLRRTDIAQPAIFALQFALSELWRYWGIEPAAVVGHSVGEIAAAAIAGALDLDDAARIAVERGRIMQKAHGRGAMLAVALTEAELAALVPELGKQVALAARNAPRQMVLSGDRDHLATLARRFKGLGIAHTPLSVNYAFHSAQMEPLAAQLEQRLTEVALQDCRIAFYSTVDGAARCGIDLGAAYWAQGMRRTIRFAEAVEAAIRDRHHLFLEVGPRSVLTRAIAATGLGVGCPEVQAFGSLQRGTDGRANLLQSLSGLYAAGLSVHWDGLYPTGGQVVSLPVMPWQRQTAWIRPAAAPDHRHGERGTTPRGYIPGGDGLLGHRLDLAENGSLTVWQSTLDSAVLSELADHRVWDTPALPASAVLEIALAAGTALRPERRCAVENLTLHKFLFADAPVELQVHLSAKETGELASSSDTLRIYNRQPDEAAWTLHAEASLAPPEPVSAAEALESLASIQARCLNQVAPAMFYGRLAELGLGYGATFRLLCDIWFRDGEALVRVKTRNPTADGRGAPSDVIDACIQSVAACRLLQDGEDPALLVPVGVARFELFSELSGSFRVHAYQTSSPDDDDSTVAYNLILRDETGRAIGRIDGLRLRRAASRTESATVTLSRKETSTKLHYYRTVWREKPLAEPAAEAGGRWLILADQSGIGAALARQLAEADASADLIYHEPGASDVGKSETFKTRLRSLLAGDPGGPPLRGIVDLWGLDAAPVAAADCGGPSRPGVRSSLDLLQALFFHTAGEMPPIWIVTRGAFAARDDGRDATAPHQAPVWGLARVLALEHPDVHCTRIDLDPAEVEDNADTLQRALYADDAESQRMCREGRWFVPRVVAEPAPKKSSPQAVGGGLLVRGDASYLITGGMGGLGLLTARWLVEVGAKHLVLMGRSAPSAEVEEALQRLRGNGAEIIVAQGDVTQAAEVDVLLAQCEATLPPLRGIFHAAGVIDDAAIMNLDDSKVGSVLAPKIDGAWALHSATAGIPLDFFVLYSSAASVFGSPGQANYAAGNAFLDSLAQHRRGLGLPALCVNWGPWSGAGMTSHIGTEAGTIPGVSLITPPEGLAALQNLIAEGRSEATVLPFDLSSLLHLYPVANGLSVFEELFSENLGAIRSIGTESGVEIRPELAEAYLEPRDAVENIICRIWKRALAIDRVGVRDSFFDLGGDSVFANQMIVEISKTYGVRLSSGKVHEAFTVENVAQMVWDTLLKEVAGLDPEDVERELAETREAALVDIGDAPQHRTQAARVAALSPDKRALVLRWARGGKAHRRTKEGQADSVMGPVRIPLGLAQARLFNRIRQEGATDRNHFFLARLTGELDVAALRAAVAEIVRRHENLRTTFDIAPGEPGARVRDDLTISVPLEDLSGRDPAQAETAAIAQGTEAAKRAFDLRAGPLIRCALYKISDQEHVFLMAAHLLIFDVWSMGVVLNELTALYDGFIRKKPSPLPELPLQYRDFAEWQRRWLDSEDAQRQLAYWTHALSDLPAPLALPGRRAGPSDEAAFREGLISIRLDPRLWDRVSQFSRARGTTPYMTMLAAFQMHVVRLTAARRFVLGMPIANRNRPDVERLIGYFTNVLPIIGQFDGDPDFDVVVDATRRATIGAYENQDLPFDRFMNVLAPALPPGVPLFRVVFSLQNTPIPSFSMPGLAAQPMHLDYGAMAPFDVTLLLIASDVLVDGQNGIGGMLHYNANLFSEDDMRTLWEGFSHTMDAALRAPESTISELGSL